MSEPNWDTYHCKHCARLYGWLPASKEYLKLAKKTTIKYFTLCATQAIDVFMFEMEELLSRDKKTGTLPNVIICEGDPRKVSEIFKVVRPPIKEAIIIGKLQDVLTFEDDEYTRTTPYSTFEPEINYAKRKRLMLKQSFERLRQYFPFDIINFDPCDNLLNPDITENRLCKALERIFELQHSTDKFLLFITTPLFDIAAGSTKKLKEDYQNNVSKYPKIGKAMLSSVKTIDYDGIDENKRLAIGVAKSIVLRVARDKGWECEHKGIYIYDNESGNRFLNSVTLCTKVSSGPSETSYVEDVIRIIKDMPTYYSYTQSSSDQSVKEHLKRVVEFRKQSR